MNTETTYTQNYYTPSQPDWFLKILVDTVESATNKSWFFDVTLFCNGQLITGTVISFSEYLLNFGGDFSNQFSGDMATLVTEQLKKMPEVVDDIVAEGKNDKIGFIHLKNIKVLSTDKTSYATQNGLLWRGRLSEITGFSIGDALKKESQIGKEIRFD